MEFEVSPDLLLLLEVHATNQPAHHPWGCHPRDIQAVQEPYALDPAFSVVLQEALCNNWKWRRDGDVHIAVGEIGLV